MNWCLYRFVVCCRVWPRPVWQQELSSC